MALSIALILILAPVASGQASGRVAGHTLAEDLQKLPSQAADDQPASLAFAKMLDSHLQDPPEEVAAALPVLQQYLHSPVTGIRRDALLAVFSLSRRPQSAEELKPILPAVYAHLKDRDVYLRQGTLIAMIGLKPQVPREAVGRIENALASVQSADDFGRALAGALMLIQPDNDDAQSAILSYLHRADMTDSEKADTVDEFRNLRPGSRVVSEIVEIAQSSPQGRLRDAAIAACISFGVDSLSQIQNVLIGIQSSATETPQSRELAREGLAKVHREG